MPSAPPGFRCSNACAYTSDGPCDDGGQGSEFAICDLGTDCADCGPRYISPPPQLPPTPTITQTSTGLPNQTPPAMPPPATPPPASPEDDKDDGSFPVWLIVLLIALSLLICGVTMYFYFYYNNRRKEEKSVRTTFRSLVAEEPLPALCSLGRL